MGEALRAGELPTTISADKSVGISVVDDGDWFAAACGLLLGQKAGTALHFTTGFDERSCQRYASGSVKPPAYFLRALLRSDQGHVWLAAAMDGSEAEWWRNLQGASRVLARFK